MAATEIFGFSTKFQPSLPLFSPLYLLTEVMALSRSLGAALGSLELMNHSTNLPPWQTSSKILTHHLESHHELHFCHYLTVWNEQGGKKIPWRSMVALFEEFELLSTCFEGSLLGLLTTIKIHYFHYVSLSNHKPQQISSFKHKIKPPYVHYLLPTIRQNTSKLY